MSRWDAFKATLRELLRPAPPVDDPNYADLLRSDEIARTEWSAATESKGGDDMQRVWDW